MHVTDLPEEIRDQLRGLLHMAQDAVIDTLGRLAEPTRTMVPDSVMRLAQKLPDGAEFVDRGFATAEHWLRSQREFTARLADSLAPAV